MSIISTHELTRRYGARSGVEGLSFEVPEGALFGFLGPNGSGKTTTIRLLMGLIRPTAGRADVLGLDCWRASRRINTDVGYLPGDVRIYRWMTGAQGLSLFGSVRGRDVTAHGRELAGLFGLDLGVRVRSMSRGMRQKLGLVLAMAHRPRLLILDEPTTSLDPLIQERLRLHLQSLSRTGHTIFFSSHSLPEVEHLCDRVAILREGRLVADETIEEMRRRSHRVVEIRWKGEAPAGPPPFLSLVERRDRVWTCRLAGQARELVGWAAGQPIEDLVVGPPDLESLFRRYYEKDPGS